MNKKYFVRLGVENAQYIVFATNHKEAGEKLVKHLNIKKIDNFTLSLHFSSNPHIYKIEDEIIK